MRVGDWTRRAVYECRRLKEAIVVGAVSLWWLGQASETSRWAVYPYMLSKLAVLWVFWHVLYSATFPYADFREHLARGGPSAVAVALVRAATCLAIVLGGAMLL